MDYVDWLVRLSSDHVLKVYVHQEVRANGTAGLLVIQEVAELTKFAVREGLTPLEK